MIAKLLTEHHLEFLSLKGSCRGSYESTHVKLLEISNTGSYIFKKTSVLNSYSSELPKTSIRFFKNSCFFILPFFSGKLGL